MTALIEKDAKTPSLGDKKEILYIKTDTILPNRAQPREYFDEKSLSELAQSIKTHGIIQPLTVREYPEQSIFSHYKYELIAGERRLRSSKLIGLDTVPCILIKTDTKTSAELAIIENLQRKDLNIFEEACAIASIIELYGLTQDQVAKKLSITQAAVANKLRILNLTEPERALILQNNLTERHARALLRIKDEQMRLKALKHTVEKMFNVKQCEEYIENLIDPSKTTPKETKETASSLPQLISSIEKAIQTTRNHGGKIKTQHAETDSEIILTISITK